MTRPRTNTYAACDRIAAKRAASRKWLADFRRGQLGEFDAPLSISHPDPTQRIANRMNKRQRGHWGQHKTKAYPRGYDPALAQAYLESPL